MLCRRRGFYIDDYNSQTEIFNDIPDKIYLKKKLFLGRYSCEFAVNLLLIRSNILASLFQCCFFILVHIDTVSWHCRIWMACLYPNKGKLIWYGYLISQTTSSAKSFFTKYFFSNCDQIAFTVEILKEKFRFLSSDPFK